MSNIQVFFDANDGTHGTELWVTDGTAAGTSMVKDIDPGAGSSGPDYITPLGNGEVLFSAIDGTDGRELWVTNGTAAGTSMVEDIYPGPYSSYPSGITPLGNGEAVFQPDNDNGGRAQSSQLWVTNGTAAGTSVVTNFSPAGFLPTNLGNGFIAALGNGEAVFAGNDGTHGTELWVTNGTAVGTSMVKDIYLGAGSSAPQDITAIGNGEAMFQALTPAYGWELWVTNGTAAGTSMVKDINPGGANSLPQDITPLGNGEALFTANDGTGAWGLWVTNGTAAGTSMIPDVYPTGFEGDAITAIGNGEALFTATDGATGAELWETNGTAAGTSIVADIPGSSSFIDTGFVPNVTCFSAGTGIATPRGEVAVEALSVGDSVSLADGGAAEVAWIGYRQVDAARHPAPTKVWPVRITAGAFGTGWPHQDLLLSPDHAVFVEDVLIPVKYLINGSTVVQVPVETVTYYHIELHQHDLLLAEGLPVESYLDTGDRANFANGDGVIRLFPDLANRRPDVAWLWELNGYAPLILFGPELDAARARLTMIAANLSPQTADAARRCA